MTRASLGGLLQKRGLSPELIQRVETCLIATEAARFSPDRSVSAKSLLNETERLLRELDKEFAA
jgi:hypothetical protein